MARKHIAVVGGGIIGSAIACELSARNVQVILLDSGNAFSNATRCSFGWINAHNYKNRHHFRLRLKSMALWRALAEKHPDIPIRFCSTLDWDIDSASIETVVQAYNHLGYQSEILDRSGISKKFPALRPDTPAAVYCPGDAVATPGLIAGFFADCARQLGAELRTGTAVTGFITQSDSLTGVQLETETIPCDGVVVAAGCGSASLVNSIGLNLPMDNRPGLLVRTNPQPKLTDAVISAPDVHFWQMDDDRLLVGRNRAGEYEAENLADFSAGLLKSVGAIAPDANNLKIEAHTLGTRPQPLDGMPVLGRVTPFSNLHLAVMHSGITLAPVIAQLTAEEILSDSSCEDFEPYTLNRFEQTQRSLAS